jgi:hypothetical protein
VGRCDGKGFGGEIPCPRQRFDRRRDQLLAPARQIDNLGQRIRQNGQWRGASSQQIQAPRTDAKDQATAKASTLSAAPQNVDQSSIRARRLSSNLPRR